MLTKCLLFITSFVVLTTEVFALSCFKCESVVHEFGDKDNCFYPENSTTLIVPCPSSCYFFQWGEPELKDRTVTELIHTVRACEAPRWSCYPEYDGPFRRHHCVTCETDLCNKSFQHYGFLSLSCAVVMSAIIFLF